MTWRLKRIKQETALAAMRHSLSKQAKYDPDGGEWVVIYNFPLPRGYNRDRTDVLILLPASYPQSPPDWFYLDPDVRKADGSRPSTHYFEKMDSRGAPTMEGWASGSLHIRSWTPSNDPLTGHSLLTVCKLIQDAFNRWLHE